jgi:hypothetical protein
MHQLVRHTFASIILPLVVIWGLMLTDTDYVHMGVGWRIVPFMTLATVAGISLGLFYMKCGLSFSMLLLPVIVIITGNELVTSISGIELDRFIGEFASMLVALGFIFGVSQKEFLQVLGDRRLAPIG